MSKITNIVEGWANYLVKDPKIEKLAKDRALKCNGCEFASDEEVYDFEDDEVVKVKGHCTKCLCPFISKLRSPNEKCPIGKW